MSSDEIKSDAIFSGMRFCLEQKFCCHDNVTKRLSNPIHMHKMKFQEILFRSYRHVVCINEKFTSQRSLFLTTRNFEVEDSDEESICAAYIYRVQPWAHTSQIWEIP